jgi:ribonuclease-3
VDLGRSEEASRGRERYALLEDVFEAAVGALFLDGGWDAAFDFVARQFEDDLDELDERTLTLANPKTALQEAAQGRGLPVPEYREVGATGPSHRRMWAFEVWWNGEEIARGEGRSKREAQQQAARRALIRLGLVPEE